MHYYEKNIVEIKTEYTNFLINILTPLLFEGIQSIYYKSVDVEKKIRENAIVDPSVNNPGVLKIFQYYLTELSSLSQSTIDEETRRIKTESRCAEWFDNLVRAVIKSSIVLLTFNASGKQCKLVNEKFHERVDVGKFVHQCYKECGRLFYNYPTLFYHKFKNADRQRNQRETYALIKDAINESIKKMLPVRLILDEYLANDYTDNTSDSNDYKKVRDMVENDNSRFFEDTTTSNETTANRTSAKTTSRSSSSDRYVDSDDESETESKINIIEKAIDNKEMDNGIFNELILGNDIPDQAVPNNIGEQQQIIMTQAQPIVSVPVVNTEEELRKRQNDPQYVMSPGKIVKNRSKKANVSRPGTPKVAPLSPPMVNPVPITIPDVNPTANIITNPVVNVRMNRKMIGTETGMGSDNSQKVFNNLLKN